jgi:HPt (histidine-containing phosphotransfer) domain-containing protein
MPAAAVSLPSLAQYAHREEDLTKATGHLLCLEASYYTQFIGAV